jgi:ribonuclease HI
MSVPMGDECEVHDAELNAIALTSEEMEKIVKNKQTNIKDIWIFCDSQAAINRINNLRIGPGQSYAVRTYQVARKLYNLYNVQLHINWVPSHRDIRGNEQADQLAKIAASSKPPSIPITSLTYLKRQIRAETLKEWNHKWETSKHGKYYQGKPKLSLENIYRSKVRTLTSQILYLRTGHGFFKSYFKQIRNTHTRCKCNSQNQTAEHLLIECSIYENETRQLESDLDGLPLTRYILLHTQQGLKSATNYLQSTQIGTRKLFTDIEEADIEDDDVTRWHRTDVGWGQLDYTSDIGDHN